MKIDELDIVTEKFGQFEVHSIKDSYSFFHININEHKVFLEGLCEYILNEHIILRYATNRFGINFEPSRQNYNRLFRELDTFIDDENVEFFDYDLDVADILDDEFEDIIEKDGKKIIRSSKIGRIGEYIFHIFLSEYFNFNCIIPKVKMTTDKNMSVHGIDALFLDKEKEMILFGESKFSKKLENGMTLVNKSLKNYEHEIRDEYKLVLTNNHLKLNGLEDVFPGQTELCIDFDEFIEETKLKYIGVPIFIAHGIENDFKEILNKLQKGIKRTKYFGLETIFFVISLPVLNKKVFIEYLTSVIKQKRADYYDASKAQR
ncbi:Hachiman antiphage defense system protein HamA [Niallia circulans]|nr:Hachiman antiphage defense system protein HamA [Niallia circulans]